jgi:pSer/pThr/pTyr-binding forkhead associated (FHA) protein
MLAGLDPTPLDGPSVLVLEGRGAGRRFPMGPDTVIGRGAEADVALTDPLVSRRHLRLQRSGSAIVAHHGRSKNGLVVNGRRRRRRRIPLRSGDELRVGDTLLLIESPATCGEPRAKRTNAGFRWTAELASVAFTSAALLAAALLLLRAAG